MDHDFQSLYPGIAYGDQSVLQMGFGPSWTGDMSCLGLSLADRDAASGAGEPGHAASLSVPSRRERAILPMS
jgi:hypothetical protein